MDILEKKKREKQEHKILLKKVVQKNEKLTFVNSEFNLLIDLSTEGIFRTVDKIVARFLHRIRWNFFSASTVGVTVTLVASYSFRFICICIKRYHYTSFKEARGEKQKIKSLVEIVK